MNTFIFLQLKEYFLLKREISAITSIWAISATRKEILNIFVPHKKFQLKFFFLFAKGTFLQKKYKLVLILGQFLQQAKEVLNIFDPRNKFPA